MKNYLKFPLPTTASWFRLPERVQALEDSSFNAADYDLADFTNTGIDPFTKVSDLPPYKVYTALLTQSGGDDYQSITSGDLTIGVTYQIKSNSGQPWDFTNVGAPNNDLGTYFVATGTIPNEWGAGELEYNTGAPVVTVLENTIGDIWFEYGAIGYYVINSNSLFTTNKTFTSLTTGGGNVCIPIMQPINSSQVGIYINDAIPPNNPIEIDGLLQIEIRVYN